MLLRIKNKISARNKLQKLYERPSLDENNKTSIEDKFLALIKNLLEKNLYDENFGSEQLAAQIGLSVSQVNRKVKALTNLSTSIYLRNIRLEYAKTMINHKSVNISEIAYDTGFSSLSYFSKCFKEYTGVSPKKFIK